MKIGPLNIKDIDYILDNISAGSAYELFIVNKPISKVREKYINYIGKEFTGVFYDNDMRPYAMLLMETKGNNKWCVDLIMASEGWEKIGLMLTRFLTRLSSDIVERSKGIIEAYSPYHMGKYLHWFYTMGFKLDNRSGNQPYRYFKEAR